MPVGSAEADRMSCEYWPDKTSESQGRGHMKSGGGLGRREEKKKDKPLQLKF